MCEESLRGVIAFSALAVLHHHPLRKHSQKRSLLICFEQTMANASHFKERQLSRVRRKESQLLQLRRSEYCCRVAILPRWSRKHYGAQTLRNTERGSMSTLNPL